MMFIITFNIKNGVQKLLTINRRFSFAFSGTIVLFMYFMKHDLKGVLKYIGVKICTHPRTEMTDILTTTRHRRDRCVRNSLPQT